MVEMWEDGNHARFDTYFKKNHKVDKKGGNFVWLALDGARKKGLSMLGY
jgi:cyclopropane fatty-acyl-phospholipid synthase-like methyltransferase